MRLAWAKPGNTKPATVKAITEAEVRIDGVTVNFQKKVARAVGRRMRRDMREKAAGSADLEDMGGMLQFSSKCQMHCLQRCGAALVIRFA